jgi:cyclic pyranopterin phosphate synthase
MSQLTDGFGRSFPYLRLSLTEACNFRCSYCLPDGYQADGRPRFLQVDEIARLVRAFAALGMSKIRLTGGEPSLRKDLDEIIATVAAVPGIRKVAITTNGTLLPRRLPGWHRAGLTALNVSMDSLQRERFRTITGHDRLPEIEQGLALAQALGLPAIKLNAVLLRGLNDDELPQWMDYLRDRPFSVRFIELDAHRRQRSLFPAPPPARRRGDRAAAGAGWHERRARPTPARRASSATRPSRQHRHHRPVFA